MSTADDRPILDVKIHEHERALEFARRENNPAKVVSALREMGQTYLKDGDAPKALTQFEEALEVAEEIDSTEEQARLWGYKGMALKDIGNFQFAKNAFNKSNQLARQLDHPMLICDSLIRIGMLQVETDEVTKGISKLEQAYAIAVEQKNAPRLVHIAIALGNCFFQLESSAKAMEYYLDALGVARERGDKPAECTILIACGNIQIQGEEFEAAIESFEKALQIGGALDDAGAEIGALTGLMRANAYQDKISLAQIYGEQAIEMAKRIHNTEAEMSVIENLVDLLVGHEQFKKAIPHFQRGLELAKENQEPERALHLLTGLAYTQYSLENADEAKALYQELLSEGARLQDAVAESTALGRLSAIYAENEEFERALEHAQQALEKAHATENMALVAEQQLLLALAHRDLGQEKKAQLYFRDALQGYRSIGAETMADHVEALQEEAGD